MVHSFVTLRWRLGLGRGVGAIRSIVACKRFLYTNREKFFNLASKKWSFKLICFNFNTCIHFYESLRGNWMTRRSGEMPGLTQGRREYSECYSRSTCTIQGWLSRIQKRCKWTTGSVHGRLVQVPANVVPDTPVLRSSIVLPHTPLHRA
jgi:hypothetical protein